MIVEHNGRQWYKKPMRKYSLLNKQADKGANMLIVYNNKDGKEEATVRCSECFNKFIGTNELLPEDITLKVVVPLTVAGAKLYLKPLQTSYECGICRTSVNTNTDKASDPVEANQVCIKKKTEPTTQVKISKLFNDKRSMLADIRQQVGIL